MCLKKNFFEVSVLASLLAFDQFVYLGKNFYQQVGPKRDIPPGVIGKLININEGARKIDHLFLSFSVYRFLQRTLFQYCVNQNRMLLVCLVLQINKMTGRSQHSTAKTIYQQSTRAVAAITHKTINKIVVARWHQIVVCEYYSARDQRVRSGWSSL